MIKTKEILETYIVTKIIEKKKVEVIAKVHTDDVLNPNYTLYRYGLLVMDDNSGDVYVRGFIIDNFDLFENGKVLVDVKEVHRHEFDEVPYTGGSRPILCLLDKMIIIDVVDSE